MKTTYEMQYSDTADFILSYMMGTVKVTDHFDNSEHACDAKLIEAWLRASKEPNFTVSSEGYYFIGVRWNGKFKAAELTINNTENGKVEMILHRSEKKPEQKQNNFLKKSK